MHASWTTIGNNDVLIETMDDDLKIDEDSKPDRSTGRQTEITGVTEDIKDAYGSVKLIIKDISADIGTQLESISAASRPKQAEMELNMGFSAQAKTWVLSGKTDCALKLKLTWEFD